MSDNPFREPHRPLGGGFTQIVRPNGERTQYAAPRAAEPEPDLPRPHDSHAAAVAMLAGKSERSR